MFNQKLAFVLVFSWGLLTPAFAKEYLVKIKEGHPLSLRSLSDVRVLDQHPAGRLVKVDLKEGLISSLISKLKTLSEVEYIVENFEIKSFRKLSDQRNLAPINIKGLQEQWALSKVNIEGAWNRAGNRGSKKITVAVIDTGVDYGHDSLKENMVEGYDFAANDADPMDETGSGVGGGNPGHGTHCAGIVGATGRVDGGVSGAVNDISIMPIRFLDKRGSGDLNNAIKSIDYAIQHGAKVISASWGAAVSRDQAKPLLEAVKRADDAGLIFVAAASNDSKNNDSFEVYPANSGYPNTITVAATDQNDKRASFSNWGLSRVHVGAPGVDIMSTLPKNKYGKLSGTSMATPLVSGLVGLVLSQNDTLTGAQVRSLLQVTGVKTNLEIACDCRVDAAQAIDFVVGNKAWLNPAASTMKAGETVQLQVVNSKEAYTYASSNEAVATVSGDGVVTAKGQGSAVITATDSSGGTLKTLNYYVGKAPSGGGGGGGGNNPPTQPNPPAETCPFKSQRTCELVCKFKPDMAWCK